jgi:hypothetical protein
METLFFFLANAGQLFKSTQTPLAQSSTINNIQHTIPLVTKPNWPIYRIKITTYLNKGMT